MLFRSEKETDVIYVADGMATFVTGGKMVGGKVTKPGQLMGTDIVGGQTHHLSKGDVIVIKTLIQHDMETGLRKDPAGNTIPRRIINKFTCDFNGKPVFSADLEPAVAANPYLQFNVRVDESGTFRFSWFDDDGSVITADEKIVVT